MSSDPAGGDAWINFGFMGKRTLKTKSAKVSKETAAIIKSLMDVPKKDLHEISGLLHPTLQKKGYVACGWLGGSYYCVDENGKLVLIEVVV